MAERELKLKFTGDATGIDRTTKQIQEQMKSIKDSGEMLRSGFQAFAAARGIAKDFQEAMVGSATSIATLVGNLGNVASAISIAGKAMGPWGAVITGLAATAGLLSDAFGMSNEKAKQLKDTLDGIKNSKVLNDIAYGLMGSGGATARVSDTREAALRGLDIGFTKTTQTGTAMGTFASVPIMETKKDLDRISETYGKLTSMLDGLTQAMVANDAEAFKSQQTGLAAYLEQLVGQGATTPEKVAKFRTQIEELANAQKQLMDSQGGYGSGRQGLLGSAVGVTAGLGAVNSQALKQLQQSMFGNAFNIGGYLGGAFSLQDSWRNKSMQGVSVGLSPITDELLRIGGLSGGLGVNVTMSQYETQALEYYRSIDTSTRETRDYIAAMSGGNSMSLEPGF